MESKMRKDAEERIRYRERVSVSLPIQPRPAGVGSGEACVNVIVSMAHTDKFTHSKLLSV